MTISVPPKGNDDRECGANFAPISVEAQFTPNLTVKIREGSFWTAQGDYVEYVGGNSATMLAATAGNAKWNVVTLDSNGLIQIVEGVESTSPTLPSVPADALPLAAIYMQETTTAITNDMVFDIRPLFVSQAETVPDLSNELAQRPTITAVNTLLANKADIGGTPDSIFTLNQNLTGIGVADAALTVNRGSEPDVSIRWNETTNKWELSNDGTVYTPIETGGTADWGLITGVLSAQTDLQAALDAKAGSVHTHLEADVTDLDKYTQAEVTGLLAGKADSVHTHIKANVTDFTETDYVHTTGIETVAGAKTFSSNAEFSTDLNVTGDLTANNGTTSLLVGGSAGFGLNDAGLDLTRIAGPNALLFWEESTQQWMVGTVGNAAQILTDSVIETKADKIVPVTVGDFAGLDAAGNLTDSGSAAADFATAAQGSTADSALQPGAIGVSVQAYDATYLVDADIGVSVAAFVHTHAYQPLDTDLTNIAALTAVSGFLKTNGANVWTVDTASYEPADATILKDADIGVNVQAYDLDLTNIAALTTTSGFLKTNGANVWSVDAASYEPANANIQAHIADATLHFTEASIVHQNISGAGTNTHAQIDTHLALTNAHIDWSLTNASNIHADNYTDTIYSHPNHTGDVTSTGDGATVIGANKVTLPMMAQVATDSFLGRDTAAIGNVEVLTAAAARTILGVEAGSTADQTAGEIEAIVTHNNLLGVVANEHLDWTADQGATNIHAGNYTDTNTTDHTLLSNIGTNTHAQIDTHVADATLHFTEASIVHQNISGAGTNTHATIDTHIADATLHEDIQTATVQTTDATATVIASVAVASGVGYTCEIMAKGIEAATGDMIGVVTRAVIMNVAGTTALVGAVVENIFTVAGSSGWSIVSSANDTTDVLDITVTGEAAHTINWEVKIRKV